MQLGLPQQLTIGEHNVVDDQREANAVQRMPWRCCRIGDGHREAMQVRVVQWFTTESLQSVIFNSKVATAVRVVQQTRVQAWAHM